MHSSKFPEWLQYTLVGTSDDKRYRHILLKEDRTHYSEVINELRQFVQGAHEDAQNHIRQLAGYSLNPFESPTTGDDPAKGYPESLHMTTLKGYFGEIFAAIIAQYFSPFGVKNWEVPVFLFRFHTVELQHIEALNQTGGDVKRRPGRTGDDFLAFQRDNIGNIVSVLYGEAKCTASHDTDMIAEAHQKASTSPIVDFLRIIEVLREKQSPLAEQWIDAIRKARAKVTEYERCDLVSYVCGHHPKRTDVWLPTNNPHESYTAQRRLEAVETHLYDVETLIQDVYYSSKSSTKNVLQAGSTQEDNIMIQPSKETLNLARKLREDLAGTKFPKSLAKLYSQHTLLEAGSLGLASWTETETADCLDNALRLLEAAFTEREGGSENWRDSVRRAGEILEWLSHPQLNTNGFPARLLSAAAYQLAGYPARSSGLLNIDISKENESNILRYLLKADFPNLLSEIVKYWATTVSLRKTELSLSWQNSDELHTGLQQRILKETVGALGILCATMRWGEEPRIEKAITKLTSVGNVLLHGDDPYSWLLAKLCTEIAVVYTRTSMRYHLTALTSKVTDTGATALERYLRQSYQTNKAIAWQSQVKGIEKLADESSFVLCTPTGSGKTTIAELAILQSLFSSYNDDLELLLQTSSSTLAIYLVPSRALATEVEAKLSRVLRKLNEPPINVTGLYGGTDWGPTDAWLTSGEQTVLICTYEKAEALIRFLGPLFLHRVSLVVIDEAHSVQFDAPVKQLQQANNRALRLEVLGSRLFTYLAQNHGRVIALSAVAAGIEKSLAGWATGQRHASPVKTSYRSVRQLIGRLECLPNHHFEIRYDLLDGVSLKYTEKSRKEEQPYIPQPFPSLPDVEGYKTGPETHLRSYLFWAALHLASQDEEGYQHAVLISVMQNINGYATDLLEMLENTWRNTILPVFFQTPSEEKASLWEKCLRSCEDYFGKESREYKLLLRGIVVHHGRMPGLLARSLVDLVQERIVHLVLATSTLSEGVNLPFETILIPSLRRGNKPITVHEFGNLVGRAGRPGYGTEGRSLVILDRGNSYSAMQSRQEYNNLVEKLKNQGQVHNEFSSAQSPLAMLLLHLQEMWKRIPGSDGSENFLNWLEQTEPLEVKDNLDENNGLDAIESLDTLDSILLSGIVEIEQLTNENISADLLEERLRQIWRRSYAYYATQEETRLQEIFARRGRALKVKIYPRSRQRRRLYRTGLPPRFGNQLLEFYPSFKRILKRGSGYALWNEEDRFDYIYLLVEQLTSLPKYKRDEKVGKSSKVDWRRVLRWWLYPVSIKNRESIDVSTWYKYVSDNFVFRFNWGLGSIVALAADEAFNGELLESSLENWSQIGLPWIVLWLKELITWGTLEPVAAYLLSKNMETTRVSAEKVAKLYYQELSLGQDANELLNASAIRDWAVTHYSKEKNLPNLKPPDHMQVRLLQDFSKVEEKRWRVVPVAVGSTLQWFDPAGTPLATCGKPSLWHDSFLDNYDFMLDVSEKMVSSESYTYLLQK